MSHSSRLTDRVSPQVVLIDYRVKNRYGWEAANILQQISYWAEKQDGGWLEVTLRDLAKLCHETYETVRERLRTLLKAGLIERVKSGRTYKYRASEAVAQATESGGEAVAQATESDGPCSSIRDKRDLMSRDLPEPVSDGPEPITHGHLVVHTNLNPQRFTAQHPDAERLTTLLLASYARHVEADSAPRLTQKAVTDMDRLLRLGPTGFSPSPVDSEHIARVIRGIFELLAEPGRNGFCWADQIQSPGNLRKHWMRLRQELNRTWKARQPRVTEDHMQALDDLRARVAAKKAAQG